MPYTTLADLTDRFGEQVLISLTDRAEVPTGAIDEDVIDQAIAGADAMIDGYLSRRHTLPLSEIPPLLAEIALPIVFWKLHLYEPDQKVKDEHAEARQLLKDIANRVVDLPIEDRQPADSGAQGVQTTDRERPMTAANMKGFI